MRKKSGHSTGYISIADFTHTSEDVSQADTIEKSWYKSLDKSKYRIDTKSTTPIALEPHSDTLQKAGEAEDRTCYGSSYRTENYCTDRYRDHVKGNSQWSDIQISVVCKP